MTTIEPGIAEFWAFWQRSAAELEAAIEGGTLLDWVEEIQQRVEAVDEGLDWEFGAGRTAQHYFCVSAKGDPELRVVAERWRAAGPPDGPVFEFHASRPGTGAGNVVLQLDQARFGFADFRFQVEVDEARERVHVKVFHPVFADVDEKLRMTATFLVLDGVLGEDEVERWLGHIELLEGPVDGLVDPEGLLGAVEALRSRSSGERFAVLQGTTAAGKPVFVTANLAVKRVDHLLLDTHFALTLKLKSARPDGLTTREEADELNALEDELSAELGTDAVWLGRETAEGKRIVHYHAAGEGPVAARLAAWAAAHPAHEPQVEATRDPSWSTLRRW
jgi:hypothetical protein